MTFLLAAVFLAFSTILLMMPAMSLKSGSHEGYQESYQWSQFGNFGLRLDGLSLPFALIIYILCTALALYSKPYMIHKITEAANEIFRTGPNSSNGARNKFSSEERSDYYSTQTGNSRSRGEGEGLSANENSHDRIVGTDSSQSQLATHVSPEMKQYVNTQV